MIGVVLVRLIDRFMFLSCLCGPEGYTYTHMHVHFHGSSYPMMDYASGVYYGLLTPCLLMFHGVHYDSFTTSYCIGFVVLWLLVR